MITTITPTSVSTMMQRTTRRMTIPVGNSLLPDEASSGAKNAHELLGYGHVVISHDICINL